MYYLLLHKLCIFILSFHVYNLSLTPMTFKADLKCWVWIQFCQSVKSGILGFGEILKCTQPPRWALHLWRGKKLQGQSGGRMWHCNIPSDTVCIMMLCHNDSTIHTHTDSEAQRTHKGVAWTHWRHTSLSSVVHGSHFSSAMIAAGNR